MSIEPPRPRRRAPRSTIDLSEIVNDPAQLNRLEFSRPESTPEQMHRLGLQSARAKLELWMEGVLFVLVTAGIVVACWYCSLIVWVSTAGPDDKRWAQSVLSAVISAGVGYLLGKRNGGK